MRTVAKAAPAETVAPARQPFRIGAADDAAEREADAIADRVVAGATLHRRAAGSAVVAAHAGTAVSAALASPGQALADRDGTSLGQRIGIDAREVRVHDGADADLAARSVGARAFTLGNHLVFARGECRPSDPAGQRLLAHELAHLRQNGAATTLRGKNGGDRKTEEETSSGEVVVEGLKTVAEKAADKQEVKEKVLKPIEHKAKSEFGALSAGEQVGVVSFGAATYGLGLGAMLGTKEGRELLAGMNFIAPLGLIPYWPISSFTYTLPKTDTDPLNFALKFDGSELLKLGRGDSPAWFSSLSLDAGWTVMPQTDTWTLTKLTGKIGILPGLTLAGSYTKGPLLTTPSEIVTGPGGESGQSVKTIPSVQGPKDPMADQPNIGGVITIDFTKLPIVPARVREILGGGVGRRK